MAWRLLLWLGNYVLALAVHSAFIDKRGSVSNIYWLVRNVGGVAMPCTALIKITVNVGFINEYSQCKLTPRGECNCVHCHCCAVVGSALAWEI